MRVFTYRCRVDWRSSTTGVPAVRRSRRDRCCQFRLDPSHEIRIALGPPLQELNQSRSIELCKELANGLAYENGRLLVGKLQQNSDNMFAISAPIVGAGAMRIRNATAVQPDRNLVGL